MERKIHLILNVCSWIIVSIAAKDDLQIHRIIFRIIASNFNIDPSKTPKPYEYCSTIILWPTIAYHYRAKKKRHRLSICFLIKIELYHICEQKRIIYLHNLVIFSLFIYYYHFFVEKTNDMASNFFFFVTEKVYISGPLRLMHTQYNKNKCARSRISRFVSAEKKISIIQSFDSFIFFFWCNIISNFLFFYFSSKIASDD